MDLIFEHLDPLFVDEIYNNINRQLQSFFCLPQKSSWLCLAVEDDSLWQRGSLYRQSISIFLFTWLLSSGFFLIFGVFCYYWNFDKSLKAHPKYHRNQIRHEIRDSLLALLVLNILTVPIFVAQVRGYAKLYSLWSGEVSTWYESAQFALFVLFSDTCMYWMHRLFHSSILFNLMHKKHHQYIIPTPFSAYAFDPLEAWIMSLPIYAYSFIWPMSREAQLIVFFTTNIWTFLLRKKYLRHSSRPLAITALIIHNNLDDNRDQFHTVHHKNVKLNFGQYLTLWDHLGGTYQDPNEYLAGKRQGKKMI